MGSSTQHLLRSVGVAGPGLKKASKDLAEEAQRRSYWLWLRRKDKAFGKTRVLGLAKGGDRETSLPLLHHPEMYWD